MARGGRRKGAPGKSYANRSDLNVDRAVQPGSSAAPVPQPQQPAPRRPLPDDIPTLNAPTQRPDMPIELGVRQADPAMFAAPSGPDSSLLLAALQADPDNYELNRMRDLMMMRGEL